jgi:hypothetical protein
MKEQNKYFTPDIEDLHVGWVGELIDDYDDKGEPVFINHKIEFSCGWLEIPESICTTLRTKYLDTDNIISLGWIKTDLEGYFVRENERSLYRLEYIGTWLDINLILKQKHPQFDINYPGEFHEASDRSLFSGECKSINELRIIHKLLKI